MRWRSRSPAETRAAARALAAVVERRGGVVCLVGDLGTGKTLFTKGLAEGLGVDPAMLASPTFVIANEMPTPRGLRLVHVDLYRLESAAELEAAGWLDWLVEGNLVVVEWGDRFPEALPGDRLEIRLERVPGGAPDERRVEARAEGAGAEALLERWRQRLDQGAEGAPRPVRQKALL